MDISGFAVIFSLLGIAMLTVSNAFLGSLPGRLQGTWIVGSLTSLVLGTVLGGASYGAPAGNLALALGLIGAGICGTGYLFHRQSRSRLNMIGGNFELIEPANEEELAGTPENLGGGEDASTPGGTDKPPGPVRRETAPGCVLQHLSGYTFLHVVLRGSDWRKAFSVNFFVYVRGDRMDFYIDGKGTVWWGVRTTERKVRIKHDELYGFIKCIDQCTKIQWDPWGTTSDKDDPLVASFKIEPQMVGNDTLYIYVTAAAGMDGTLTISSAIPGAPTVGSSETSTQVSMKLGSNAFKCVVTPGGGAAAAGQ